MDHWPNLISIILDNDAHLNQYKQPLYYFDQVQICCCATHLTFACKVISFTYFLTKVDAHITVAAVYKEKQKANDPLIRGSLNTIADHLRNAVIFAKLRS